VRGLRRGLSMVLAIFAIEKEQGWGACSLESAGRRDVLRQGHAGLVRVQEGRLDKCRGSLGSSEGRVAGVELRGSDQKVRICSEKSLWWFDLGQY